LTGSVRSRTEKKEKGPTVWRGARKVDERNENSKGKHEGVKSGIGGIRAGREKGGGGGVRRGGGKGGG